MLVLRYFYMQDKLTLFDFVSNSYTILLDSHFSCVLRLGFLPLSSISPAEIQPGQSGAGGGVVNDDKDFLHCFACSCSVAVAVEDVNETIKSMLSMLPNIEQLNLGFVLQRMGMCIGPTCTC